MALTLRLGLRGQQRRCVTEDRVCSSLRNEVFSAEMSADVLAGVESPPISTVVAKFNLQKLRSENLITGCINNSFCRLNGEITIPKIFAFKVEHLIRSHQLNLLRCKLHRED